MGYNVFVLQTRFSIASQNIEAAWRSVKSLSVRLESPAFVRRNESAKAADLAAALFEWRWPAEFDDQGNLIDLEFTGEKLGDDQILFAALAPFVNAGSFIVVAGDDGKVWRWRFDGKCCHCELGRIVFDA